MTVHSFSKQYNT